MFTIFEKLTEFRNKNSLQPLTHIQKSSLGRIISNAWRNQPDTYKLDLVTSKEDTGVFTVVLYPDNFSSVVEQLIESFYCSIISKRRKRVQTKKAVKVVWSEKSSTKNESIK